MGDVWSIIGADDDDSYWISVLLDCEKDMHLFARQKLAAFLGHEGERVRTSVLSTALFAHAHLRQWRRPALCRDDELRPREGEKRRAAYDFHRDAAGEARKPRRPYTVLALQAAWNHHRTHVAPQQPTVFMVDELTVLGGLRAFKETVTLLRGYGLRCCLFLQFHAQLKSLYPLDHVAITENCGAILTFGHRSMGMSRPIADVLGDMSPDALFGMTGES